MDNRPLKDIPEKELKDEIERRKDERDRAYKAWLLQTRPKRARFIRCFSLTRGERPPLLMLIGPLVVAWLVGVLFPTLAKSALALGMGTALFCLFLCIVGSFFEFACGETFYKMHSNEENPKSKNP